MIIPTKLLFELYVYRIDENAYLRDFHKFLIQNSTSCYQPTLDSFGGQWQYNEIIGYLKFYISGGTQLRVEYHKTDATKIVKTRKKTFVLNNDSFCTRNIYKSMTNQDLIDVIKDCIQDCKNRLNPRHIDTTFIDNTLIHTDWTKVIV